jgi:hypothetical protein
MTMNAFLGFITIIESSLLVVNSSRRIDSRSLSLMLSEMAKKVVIMADKDPSGGIFKNGTETLSSSNYLHLAAPGNSSVTSSSSSNSESGPPLNRNSPETSKDAQVSVVPANICTEERQRKFSCPYRKRNPFRFNVRDHPTCALTSFPDNSQLK